MEAALQFSASLTLHWPPPSLPCVPAPSPPPLSPGLPSSGSSSRVRALIPEHQSLQLSAPSCLPTAHPASPSGSALSASLIPLCLLLSQEVPPQHLLGTCCQATEGGRWGLQRPVPCHPAAHTAPRRPLVVPITLYWTSGQESHSVPLCCSPLLTSGISLALSGPLRFSH